MQRPLSNDRTPWNIHNNRYYFTDETALKLRHMFNELLKAFEKCSPSVTKSLQTSELSLDERRLLKSTNPDKIQVGPDYQGPHINGPITRDTLVDLIEAFQKEQVLHEKYVCFILHQAREILKTLPNFNRINLSNARHVFIVGDLHGQLADLLYIFSENGLPSAHNSYIFNGDFVDRGSNSVEVLLLLLVALIVYPHSVFLNRGNHEDCFIALRYGFESEINHKYTKCKGNLLDLCNDIFSWLPIYSIIDTGISELIVLHGGLSDRIHLNQINSIARNHYLSLCIQPDSKSRSKHLAQDEYDDYQQIRDILWCDPDPEDHPGCRYNSIRHMASFFGPDVTEQFLSKNSFSMLIRSHEAKEKGYEFQHNRKVLTLFSASNYNDECNKGAIARWDYQLDEPIISTYSFEDVDPIEKYSFSKQLTLLEDPVYQSLMEQIIHNSDVLRQSFEKSDPKKTGRISLTTWANILNNVLQINFPWINLRSKFVREDTKGILYKTMFEESVFTSKEFQKCQTGIMDDVYASKDLLIALFNIIDSDHSGTISRNEFSDTISSLVDENIEELFSAMTWDGNTEVTMNAFLETFRVVHLPK